jgi:hypothetical protein
MDEYMADLRDVWWREISGLWRIVIVVLICMIVAAFVCSAAFVAYLAVIRITIPVTRAIFLVLLILSTGSCFVLFLYNLEFGGGRLEIASHWGGLGGGLGGWRVSKSLTYLIATTGLVVLLATVISHQVEMPKPSVLDPYILERYRSTIQLSQRLGVKSLTYKVVDAKLVLSGVTDQINANKVWDEIKLANPAYDDIQVNFTIQNGSAIPK